MSDIKPLVDDTDNEPTDDPDNLAEERGYCDPPIKSLGLLDRIYGEPKPDDEFPSLDTVRESAKPDRRRFERLEIGEAISEAPIPFHTYDEAR